jgi:hypothetical protein
MQGQNASTPLPRLPDVPADFYRNALPLHIGSSLRFKALHEYLRDNPSVHDDPQKPTRILCGPRQSILSTRTTQHWDIADEEVCLSAINGYNPNATLSHGNPIGRHMIVVRKSNFTKPGF